MIRRKRIQTTEEKMDKEQTIRQNSHLRKDSVGRLNRFNYAVDTIISEEGNEQVHSRNKRFHQYQMLTTENQSLLQQNSFHHQPSRLKKDYLYGIANQTQTATHFYDGRDLDISSEFNQTGHVIGREEFKNAGYQAKRENGLFFPNQTFISSSSHQRRNYVYSDQCTELAEQSAINTMGLDCSISSESLELQYQQTYAINQLQKRRQICKDVPTLNQPPHRKKDQANSKSIGRTTLLDQNQHSVRRADTRSGNLTQRHASFNQSANKLQHYRGLETKKTSPIRTEGFKTKYMSEMATLRVSPAKIHSSSQAASSIRMIEDFSLKVWHRMDQLRVLLESVRAIR